VKPEGRRADWDELFKEIIEGTGLPVGEASMVPVYKTGGVGSSPTGPTPP